MTENIPAKARIAAVFRERYQLATDAGEAYARLKAGAFQGVDARAYPTVGDWVEIIPNPLGDAWITAVAPRKSLFMRKLPGKSVGEQAVAANFDDVLIVTSLNQDFSGRRIERYVALAWQSGGTPVIVLTKRDLATAETAASYESAAQEAAPFVDVLTVSAHTGEGLDALRERLSQGQTAALLGSSGVGKSSLVNALLGCDRMHVAEIREDDARGRHTTTHRQLITLPTGACIIDTPGMRELGLWDANEGVAAAFDDIESLSALCRFSDCAHDAEPGCAVKQAIEEGALDAGRLRSYHKLQREAARRQKKQ